MALTAKPISTISYNTEQFLERKLEQLYKAKIIVDYRWIMHYGEDGDKDHIHLIMFPNKRVDTGELQEEFKEVVPSEEKPLGVLPIRTSKADHWLMYVLHDEHYLKAHNSDNDGDGKIPYEITDIKTPFPEQLARDYKKAIALRKTKNQEIMDSLIKEHQSLTQTMYNINANPLHIIAIYQALLKEKEIERYNDSRVDALMEYIKEMQKAIDIKGSVTEVEELPQLKVDEKLEEENKRIKQVKEEEEEDYPW